MDLLMQSCRVCGCTDFDCSKCIEKTGEPCYWVDANLCSACEGETRNIAVACHFHFLEHDKKFVLKFETTVVVGTEHIVLKKQCRKSLKAKNWVGAKIDEVMYSYL